MENTPAPAQTTYERKPNQDIRFRRSKDNKYICVDVIQTYIFSSKYFEALARNTKASDGVAKEV